MPVVDDLAVAIATASAGAAVVRARFGTPFDRHQKGGLDFATDVDVEAERAMIDVLREARPDDAVLGEEFGRSGPTAARRTWLLDPLCGTLNFAAATRLVAVNVALAVEGGTPAAAVADPFSDEVFSVGGGRATLRRGGAEVALEPDSGSRLVDVNLDPPFPGAPSFSALRLLGDHDFTSRFGPRVISSTLALAWVAAGRRAAYVTDGDLRDNVHFAAGIAVCRGAGCVVTDLAGNPPGGPGSGLLAAADAETHAALLTMVKATVV